MDLLVVCNPHLALARGYAGGGDIFMIKQKMSNEYKKRDKMSNLSNNMMISELFVNNNYN
jgi:hypothetical protein